MWTIGGNKHWITVTLAGKNKRKVTIAFDHIVGIEEYEDENGIATDKCYIHSYHENYFVNHSREEIEKLFLTKEN